MAVTTGSLSSAAPTLCHRSQHQWFRCGLSRLNFRLRFRALHHDEVTRTLPGIRV